jgi:hypothetical protein
MEADSFRLRIVHAGFDAPTVGIDVGNDDATSPEVPALERFMDTGEAGVSLPAETALQVGIVAGDQAVTAFTVPNIIPAGSEVLVVATGEVSKTPGDDAGFSLLAAFADGSTAWIRQNPMVYALHASPEAPAVDVYAGQAELIDNLEYGALSAGIQVPPGNYDLDFFVAEAGATPRPDGDPAVTGATWVLEAGRRYLAVATGPLDDFQLLGIADDFAGDATTGTLRVVHASAGAPAVDIGTFTGDGLDTPLVSNLAFSSAASDDLVLAPAAYDIGVAAAGTTDTVAEFPNIDIAAGDRVFAVAGGELGGEERPFGLFLVSTSSSTLDNSWSVSGLANQK